MIGSNCSAPACRDQAGATVAVSRAASLAGVATISLSNGSPSTDHAEAAREMTITLAEDRTSAPFAVNQASAGAGRSSLRFTRGNSKSAEPGPLKRASFKTRRKTMALACSAGVFKAATHRGSMSSWRTQAGNLAVSWVTLICGSHWKPVITHPAAAASSASLACHGHPECLSTAFAKAPAGCPAGNRSPWPCAFSSASGVRISSRGASAPTKSMSRSSSV